MNSGEQNRPLQRWESHRLVVLSVKGSGKAHSVLTAFPPVDAMAGSSQSEQVPVQLCPRSCRPHQLCQVKVSR